MYKDKSPFIPWGNFKSEDPNNPDVLDLQVADIELFSTSLSVNAKVNHKSSDGKWYAKILALKYFESFNSSLLNLWEEAFHKGWIRLNCHVRIKTWLEKSKRNAERKIRRYKLLVLD